jgi:hypothetical protein
MVKQVILGTTIIAQAILCHHDVNASTDTIGPNGINSAGLLTVPGAPLDGSGISIGQVEPGRPGKQNVPDTTEYNNFVTPFKVFDRSLLIHDDLGLGSAGIHAENVASIMISTDTTPVPPDMNGAHFAPTGVAGHANLLSIAARPTSSEQDDYAVSSQTIVSYSKNNADGAMPLRAINMSFGVTLPGPNPLYDGNSTLTSYVDWSAKNDDVL